MFYEPQYYKVEHQSPIALFGYILPLEAMAVKCGPTLVERVKAAYGTGSYSFIRVHAEEDPSHVDKAVAAMRGIGDQEERLIEENMEQTTFAYLTMLDEIRRKLDKNDLGKRPLAP
jgi:hypothetical protein